MRGECHRATGSRYRPQVRLPELGGLPRRPCHNGRMHIIITVTGVDHVGIVAGVATALADLHVNIVNVSQTLMDQYFTMIMEGRLTDDSPDLIEVQDAMREAGDRVGVLVRVQSEAIFDAMHRL